MRIILLAAGMVLAACLADTGAIAQQLQALARLEASGSSVTSRPSGDVDITLKLTQGVPFRVFTLDEPTRLVLDFRVVNFDNIAPDELIKTDLVTDLRYGLFRPGWSRMVLTLFRPMSVFTAEMKLDPNDGDGLLKIRLTPQDPEEFAAASGARFDDVWALPETTTTPEAKLRQTGDRKVIVALDPGHGGIDPGAQYSGYTEADLMLTLARELKELLVLSGRYEVVLTRQEDHFLSLEGRTSQARLAGADVLISLHADALSEGTASGTTVYTLSDTASDEAGAKLAQGHDRGDLLAGVDLSDHDDVVAGVLMDLARLETEPRSERLAGKLVSGIGKAVGRIRSRPHLKAGFSVLRAPDIPSVLVEFGFMSNPRDLSNLASEEWRKKAILGVLTALDQWSIEDAAEARLLRQ